MNYNINFPNLGIYFDFVPKSFNIGNFPVALYGIILALGMVGGLFVALALAKASGQKKDTYYDLCIWGIIVSVICARIYYVAFSWDQYKDNLLEVFNLRQGGIAIYGAVIGAIGTAIVLCKIKKVNFFVIVDTAISGLITGQIIGRWGNFVNREVFGEYTDNVFAMQLPVDMVRPQDISPLIKENIVNINGIDYIQVHPTFLYESVLNLVVLGIMLFFFFHKSYNGQILLIYITGYGYVRAFVEGIRTDQLMIPNSSIPVSQLVGFICAVVGTVLLIIFGIKAAIKNKQNKLAEAIVEAGGDGMSINNKTE